MFFAPISKTPILQKSVFSCRKIAIFQLSSLQKSNKTRCKNDIKKNIEKMLRKSNFGLHVGLQNPLKSLRKAMRNEACFATLCNSPGSRRKLTETMVCIASKWLRIWLGLLHPSSQPSINPSIHQSINPSIHWSAPRRPNHPSKSCNLHISPNAMPLEAPKSAKIEVQGLQNLSKKQL